MNYPIMKSATKLIGFHMPRPPAKPAPPWSMPLIGLLLVLGLTFGLGFLIGSDRYEENVPIPHYRFGDDAELAKSNVPYSMNKFWLVDRTPCVNPHGHDESDLCAQWRAARAAELSAWASVWSMRLTAIGALISGLGFFALMLTIFQGRKALSRARKSNRIAKESAEVGLRAYMVFRVKVKSTELDSNSPYILAKVIFQNTGQTPALELQVYARLRIGYPGENEDFFDCSAKTGLGSRGVLGANSKSSKVRKWGITTGDARDIKMGRKQAYLFGEVTYKDVFGNSRKLTFRRFLAKKNLDSFTVSSSGESSN